MTGDATARSLFRDAPADIQRARDTTAGFAQHRPVQPSYLTGAQTGFETEQDHDDVAATMPFALDVGQKLLHADG